MLCTTGVHCSGHASSVTDDGKRSVCSCSCTAAYTGSTCRDCAAGYSLKSGTCQLMSTCPPGFIGVTACTKCDVARHCNGHAVNVTDDGARENCVCQCNMDYAGATCDTCKAGYYFGDRDLGETGCVPCSRPATCSDHGSATLQSPTVCKCECDPKYRGPRCAACAVNFIKFPTCTEECTNALCNSNAAAVGTDDAQLRCTCSCLPSHTGATCDKCAAGYTLNSSTTKCDQCNVKNANCTEYALDASVVDNKCACMCSALYNGALCELCVDNTFAFPTCAACTDAFCNGRGTSQRVGASGCNCTCQEGYMPPTCASCAAGYVKGSNNDCSRCVVDKCNGNNARSATVVGGQCQCNCTDGYDGATCDRCGTGYALETLSGRCEQCNNSYCNDHGTAGVAAGGAGCGCKCLAEYAEPRCRDCAPNHIPGPNTCVECTSKIHCNGRALRVTGDGATCKCDCMLMYQGASCGECRSPRLGPRCACPDETMDCPMDGTCLSTATMCDGVQDCSTGDDERWCDGFWMVAKQFNETATLACPSAIQQSGVPTFSLCKQMAVLRRHPVVVFNTSTATCATAPLLCINNDVCRGCAQKSTALAGGSVLRMYVRSTSDVPRCMEDYHCNGNGVFSEQGVASECICTCSEAFIGATCDVRRSLTVIETFVIITSDRVADPSLLMSAMVNVSKSLGMALTFTLLSYESVQTGGTAYLMQVDANTDATLRRSFVESLVESSGNTRLFVQQSISHLGVKLLDITALSTLVPPRRLTCAANDTTCSFPMNDTQHIRLLTVRAYGNEVPLIREFNQTSTQPECMVTNNAKTQSGACTNVTVCTFPVSNAWNFSRVINVDFVGTRTVLEECPDTTVEFTASSGKGSSAASFDVPLEIGISRAQIFYIWLMTMAISSGVSFLIIIGLAYLLHRTVARRSANTLLHGNPKTLFERIQQMFILRVPEFTLPIQLVDVADVMQVLHRWRVRMSMHTMTLVFSLFLIMSLIIGILFARSGSPTTNYVVVLEGYRDHMCQSSPYSFLPHHLSIAPATEQCTTLNSMGTSIGFVSIAAKCDENTRSVRWRASRNAGECEVESRLSSFSADTSCVKEADVFPYRTGSASFYRLRCMSVPQSLMRKRNMTSFSAPDEPVVDVAAKDAPYPYGGGQRGWGQHMFRGTVQQSNSTRADRLLSFSQAPAGTDNESFVFFDGPGDTPSWGHDAPIGKEFNEFFERQGDPHSGTRAFRDALRFQSIMGTSFDFGHHRHGIVTVNYWIKANIRTKGFVFILSDDWYNSKTSQSPIVERLHEVLEGGTPWFSSWNVYASLFADGESRTLRFVTASDGELKQHVWSLGTIAKDGLFNGGWHMVTLVFALHQGRPDVQLYIDAQTSFLQEGWKKCLQHPVESVRARSRGRVFTADDTETVQGRGVLTLGHLNAALAHFTVLDAEATHWDVLLMGSPKMRDAGIPGSHMGFLVIAVIMTTFVGGLLVREMVLFILARRAANKVDMAGVAEHHDNVGTGGKKDASGIAGQIGNVKPLERFNTTRFKDAPASLIEIFLVAVNYAQRHVLVLGSWSFPREYMEMRVSWLGLFMFDLISFPDVPLLTTPILQFTLRACLFSSCTKRGRAATIQRDVGLCRGPHVSRPDVRRDCRGAVGFVWPCRGPRCRHVHS